MQMKFSCFFSLRFRTFVNTQANLVYIHLKHEYRKNISKETLRKMCARINII